MGLDRQILWNRWSGWMDELMGECVGACESEKNLCIREMDYQCISVAFFYRIGYYYDMF